MLKSINTALSLFVTLVVWCAVISLAIVTFHMLFVGGFTVLQMLHS